LHRLANQRAATVVKQDVAVVFGRYQRSDYDQVAVLWSRINRELDHGQWSRQERSRAARPSAFQHVAAITSSTLDLAQYHAGGQRATRHARIAVGGCDSGPHSYPATLPVAPSITTSLFGCRNPKRNLSIHQKTAALMQISVGQTNDATTAERFGLRAVMGSRSFNIAARRARASQMPPVDLASI
jgi:hypothetical protein